MSDGLWLLLKSETNLKKLLFDRCYPDQGQQNVRYALVNIELKNTKKTQEIETLFQKAIFQLCVLLLLAHPL